MLEHKDVDVNIQGPNKLTALMWAVVQGDIAIVDTLLKRKDIDATAQDAMGRTALKLAELYNRLDMLQALIDHQVNKWLNTQRTANVAEDALMELPILPLLSRMTRNRS